VIVEMIVVEHQTVFHDALSMAFSSGSLQV
jgi:hypothetical protein